MTNHTWSRRDLFKRGTILGGLMLAPGLVSGCQRTQPGTGQSTGSTLDKIRDQGYVDVGFANEAPYAFRKGGELVGEAPAIHNAIFSALGVDELRPHASRRHRPSIHTPTPHQRTPADVADRVVPGAL